MKKRKLNNESVILGNEYNLIRIEILKFKSPANLSLKINLEDGCWCNHDLFSTAKRTADDEIVCVACIKRNICSMQDAETGFQSTKEHHLEKEKQQIGDGWTLKQSSNYNDRALLLFSFSVLRRIWLEPKPEISVFLPALIRWLWRKYEIFFLKEEKEERNPA